MTDLLLILDPSLAKILLHQPYAAFNHFFAFRGHAIPIAFALDASDSFNFVLDVLSIISQEHVFNWHKFFNSFLLLDLKIILYVANVDIFQSMQPTHYQILVLLELVDNRQQGSLLRLNTLRKHSDNLILLLKFPLHEPKLCDDGVAVNLLHSIVLT